MENFRKLRTVLTDDGSSVQLATFCSVTTSPLVAQYSTGIKLPSSRNHSEFQIIYFW